MLHRRVLSLSVAALGALAAGGIAADHGDSPSTRVDPRLDIPDMYLFQSPQTPANSVMIMTTAPLSRIVSQNNFTPGASYEFRIDETLSSTNPETNGTPDSTYRIVFGKLKDGKQSMKVLYKGTAGKFTAKGETGAEFALPNGGKVIAKEFDDPFFFDFIGFRRGYQFNPETSRDFFPGLNVMAIVLEVPNSTFSNNTMGLWGVTVFKRKQVDRNGRPVINSVLITGAGPTLEPVGVNARKDAFNRGQPVNDRRDFRAIAIATLSQPAFGNSPTQAAAIADLLLPDILTYDKTNAGGFLNGRRLEDDVIDAALSVATSGNLTTDYVDLTDDFLEVFPYLLPPNN